MLAWVIESVRVPGDEDAAFVRAADGMPPRAVFLAGVCANASAYLHGFPEAARANGGVLAIEGDIPWPHAPGFRTLSHDVARQNARIQAALAARGTAMQRPPGPDPHRLYSLGATLTEELVADSPDRYARVVLIGSPNDPRIPLLSGARAVEMPGCTHGPLADGDRVRRGAPPCGPHDGADRVALPP